MTDWFPAEIDPVRKGWYVVQYWGFAPDFWRYWDGKNWKKSKYSRRLCTFGKKFNGDRWRGLAEPSV